jgi:hypothetical protein
MSRKSINSMEDFPEECSSEQEFLLSPPKSKSTREKIGYLIRSYKICILHSFLFSISIISTLSAISVRMSAPSNCLEQPTLWSELRTPPVLQIDTLTMQHLILLRPVETLRKSFEIIPWFPRLCGKAHQVRLSTPPGKISG